MPRILVSSAFRYQENQLDNSEFLLFEFADVVLELRPMVARFRLSPSCSCYVFDVDAGGIHRRAGAHHGRSCERWRGHGGWISDDTVSKSFFHFSSRAATGQCVLSSALAFQAADSYAAVRFQREHPGVCFLDASSLQQLNKAL